MVSCASDKTIVVTENYSTDLTNSSRAFNNQHYISHTTYYTSHLSKHMNKTRLEGATKIC